MAADDPTPVGELVERLIGHYDPGALVTHPEIARNILVALLSQSPDVREAFTIGDVVSVRLRDGTAINALVTM